MNTSHEYVQTIIKMHAALPHGQQKIAKIWQQFETLAVEADRVDWPASWALAVRHRTQMKACFQNCRRIALKKPRYQYQEGIATAIIPIEHAWLIDTSTGLLIDPTLCLDFRNQTRAVDYFGVPIPIDVLRDSHISNCMEPTWLKVVLDALVEV